MVDNSPSPPVSGTDGIYDDAELESLVNQFETRYNVSIKFTVALDTGKYTGSKSSSGTNIGVCRIYASGRKEVFINQSWFLSSSDSGKKVVAFHELAHCQFNRNHDSRVFSNGMPMSLMYPIINPILAFFDYEPNKEYYLEELNNTKSSAPMMVFGMTSTGECTAGEINE